MYNEPKQETKVVRSGGLGLGSILTIVFVVLKLCGVIDWNWFWVLSPIIFSIGWTSIASSTIFMAFIYCF